MYFSVIIPVYNCEAYLEACLASVIAAAKEADAEIICVDDGSADGSGAILDAYVARVPQLRAVHQKNGGEGAARNAGLDAAQGDWIYFLDSDDVMNEGTLAECARMIEAHPRADLVSIQLTEFADGTEPDWAQPGQCETRVYDTSEKIELEPYGLHIWCAAYRRTLLEGLRFGGLKIGADRVYIASVLERANQVVFSDYVGLGYRARTGSAVNTRYKAVQFLHDLRHRMAWVEVFRTTRKRYAPYILAFFAKSFTEYMGHLFFEMTSADQRQAAPEWFAAFRDTAKLSCWPAWPRLVMRACGAARLRAVAWVLCCLPYWLKTHGVNRGFKILPKPLVEKA